MGCITSKRAASSPVLDHPAHNNNGSLMTLEQHSFKNQSGPLKFDGSKSRREERPEDRCRELKKSKKEKENSHSKGSFSFKLGYSHRYVQAEQTAAGWPTWLSAAAGEAIDGWVPLRADAFEKLEKVNMTSKLADLVCLFFHCYIHLPPPPPFNF